LYIRKSGNAAPREHRSFERHAHESNPKPKGKTMDQDAILGILTLTTYFGMLGAEAIWPARVFPKIRGWRFAGIGFLGLLLVVGVMTPLLLPVEWLARHRVLDGTRLGVIGGVGVGLLVLELVGYFVHRAEHRFSFMWRWMHQVHHSATRIDVASSALFHPFDLLAQNVLAIGIGTFVLGLDPLAAGILGYIGALLGIFQHLNMRTPHWLGYFVQRPEAHCIHHQLNVHAYNYGNIVLWDMVFGTYKNPATFEGRVGFAEKPAIFKLLFGRDVSGGLGGGLQTQPLRDEVAELAAVSR
jgi:sterol desaturase/sphingolipid hydroxylase (fatty acid hydroxylase superfamily)